MPTSAVLHRGGAKRHVQNWDDYRFVAALARTGSLAETIAGNLSITTTDSIYMSGVSEMIDDFHALHPSLRLSRP